MLSALRLLASVFFLPRVMSFSARRCASFALGYVVVIDSCVKRESTRLRRSACLCAEERPKWRYFICPPAMAGVVMRLGLQSEVMWWTRPITKITAYPRSRKMLQCGRVVNQRRLWLLGRLQKVDAEPPDRWGIPRLSWHLVFG